MTDDTAPTIDRDTLRATLTGVRAAVSYSYEAGDYHGDMTQDVARYCAGDGGLLNALGDALALLDALDAETRRADAAEAEVARLRSQDWVTIYDAQDEVHRLRGEVSALTSANAGKQSLINHLRAERDEARAEVERLKSLDWVTIYDASDEAQLLRAEVAAVRYDLGCALTSLAQVEDEWADQIDATNAARAERDEAVRRADAAERRAEMFNRKRIEREQLQAQALAERDEAQGEAAEAIRMYDEAVRRADAAEAERDVARGRLGDATAQIKRIATERNEARAEVVEATAAVQRATEEVARADKQRDEARRQVEAVRALHVPEWVVIDYVGGSVCRECREPVESEPCATIRALGDKS